MDSPILIGITGVIGSGKSTVARAFERLGAYRIDSDKLAHRIIQKNKPAYSEIVKTFGRTILDRRGRILRKRLRKVVFDDPAKRRALEAIVHPRVAKAIASEIEKAILKGRKVAVVEVPLLFEAGLEGMFDYVITVTCDERTLKSRAAARDKDKAGEIEKILNAQLPQKEKARRSDFVIDNSKTQEQTIADAERVWREILKRHEHARG